MELGVSRSKDLGTGLEYADFREYVEGDDIRYVDWYLSARSVDPVSNEPKLYTKVFHAEKKEKTVVVYDNTESMLFGDKVEAALYTASYILEILHRLEDSVDLIIVDRDVKEYRGLSGREAVAAIVNRVCSHGVCGDLELSHAAKALRRYRRRDLLVVVTDYANTVSSYQEILSLAKAMSTPVLITTIAYLWEIKKPMKMMATLQGLEKGVETVDLDKFYQEIEKHIAKVKAVIKAYRAFHETVLGLEDAYMKRLKILAKLMAARSKALVRPL